jgi:hypothetical protein
VADLGRRSFLRTALAATAGAVIAACSRGDAEAFGVSGESVAADGTNAAGSSTSALRVDVDPSASQSGSTDSMGDSSSTTAAEQSTTTSTEATTSTTSTTGQETTASTAPPQSGGAIPAGGQMVISFTYDQLGGGKNVPPYVAVWVENAGGELLTTVSLWYQQFGRGERWLPDLRRWYNVDQNRMNNGGSNNLDAISGPTRSPGSFQVSWNGQANGAAVPPGSYFVCIESARERGPYSLIREQVSLSGSALQVDFFGDGELFDASVSVQG